MPDLPDWYAAAVLKGLYGTELKTIAVDVLGRLYAVLRALYGVTPKDVQCDTNGNLTLNLKAQDLSEIINRPKYGGALQSSATVNLTASGENVFVTVSGKGILYGGFIMSLDSNIQTLDEPRIYLDGQLLSRWSWDSLKTYGLIQPDASIISLLVYDTTSPVYTAVLRYGITFESSISLRYWCTTATSRYLTYSLLYALV